MKRIGYSDIIKGGLSFDAERFSKPDNCFYPVFSWIWNDVLDKETVRRQIDEMYEGGIRCFYIIPEPKDFRPYTMVTNLEPDYLTDEFMEYVRFCADYAESKGMYMWLYDEGGWPSGHATGKVVVAQPDAVRKRLLKHTVNVKKGEVFFERPEVKASFIGNIRIKSGHVFEEDCTVTEFCVEVESGGLLNGAYADISESLSTKTFIELTHEKYKKYIGDHFGKTVPFMFTDEPSLALPTFSYGFEALFKEKYGYDILDHLPVLFDTSMDSDEDCKVRIDYHALCGELFDKNFLEIQREWCEKNGLFFTGHLDNDHRLDYAVNQGYSSYINSLSGLHVPGIDVIWRQIDYGKGVSEETSFFPRIAVSAASSNGSNLTVSESFGVYGSGYTYDEMRYVLNYQFLRGINIINFMSISYGREKYLAFAERPSFGKEKPGYENLQLLNDYTARMTYLSSVGLSGVEALLYLPTRDFFAGGEARKSALKSFNDMGKSLEDEGIDFHICDDAFVRKAEISGDGIKLGNNTYKYIYIPRSQYIPRDVAEKLKRLQQKAPSVCYSSEGFASIRATKRVLENGDMLYLFVNEGNAVSETVVSFEEVFEKTYELDAVNGKVYFVENSLSIKLELQPGESKCYFRTNEVVETVENPEKVKYSFTIALDSFEMAKKKSFILDEKGGYCIYHDDESVFSELGSWDKDFGLEFSGDVSYKTSFELEFEPCGTVCISLGKVEHSAFININGSFAGRTVFNPMDIFVDSNLFRKGKNTVEIVVSNTAANQFVLSGTDKLYEAKEIGPYNDRSKDIEKDHLDGGLYGPVILKFVK